MTDHTDQARQRVLLPSPEAIDRWYTDPSEWERVRCEHSYNGNLLWSLVCPFCNRLWARIKAGHTCDCGAWFSMNGSAVRRKQA